MKGWIVSSSLLTLLGPCSGFGDLWARRNKSKQRGGKASESATASLEWINLLKGKIKTWRKMTSRPHTTTPGSKAS